MARRHNGEGSWGTKTIKGVTYKYFRNTEGKYFYGKTNSEINTKRRKWEETQKQHLTSAARLLAIMFFPGFWIKKNWKSNGIQPMAMRPA